jgi:hypothetical protein
MIFRTVFLNVVIFYIANNILKTETTQGVIHMLEIQAGKVATQQLLKYIPFIGQAVSARLQEELNFSINE